MELVFLPRTLVDSIEDETQSDYDLYISTTRALLKACKEDLKKIDSDLTDIRNKLKNSHLTNDQKKSENFTQTLFEGNRRTKILEREALESKLKEAGNTGGTRIEKRYLRWKWILKFECHNGNVKKIVDKIKQQYDEKSADYKKKNH